MLPHTCAVANQFAERQVLISAYTGAITGGLITAFDHAPCCTLDRHNGKLVAPDRLTLGWTRARCHRYDNE